MRDRWSPSAAEDGERCEPFRELLSAWLDGELPPTLMEAVDQHLETCPHCRTDVDGLRRTVALIRKVLAPDAAHRTRERGRPGRTRRREAAASSPNRRRGNRPLGLAAAAIAIALASSALTYGVARRGALSAPSDVASGVIEAHVRALTGERLVEVASRDSHTVKPWFDRHVPFSPVVPRLETLGFPLLGGRVDHIAGARAAGIMYGLRRHVIGVFTWPAAPSSPGAGSETAPHTERGYSTLGWVDGGMQYWVVSDVSLAELRAFVVAFRTAEGAGDEDAARR